VTLIVEDGTGMADADALVSLVFFRDYSANLGRDTSSFNDDAAEQAIRRASLYLATSFDWDGFPVGEREQAMAFPRHGITDRYGYYVDSDSVPKEIQHAACEIAYQEAQSPGSLNPVSDPSSSGNVIREKIGKLEIEYDGKGTPNSEAVRPVLLAVRDLLRGFLGGGRSTNPIVGTSERA